MLTKLKIFIYALMADGENPPSRKEILRKFNQGQTRRRDFRPGLAKRHDPRPLRGL